METKQILAITYLLWVSGLITVMYYYCKQENKLYKILEASWQGGLLSFAIPFFSAVVWILAKGLWLVILTATGVS